MIYRPRIIPILTIDNGGLVKTTKFKKPIYLGDPINATKIFNEKNVDELCILDISATKNRRQPNFDLLYDIATEAFMPLSYGGGITSFDDAKKILKMGFEKLIFNSALINNKDLIKEIIKYAGAQSVVASIDYRTNLLGKKSFYTESGRIKINITPEKQAIEAEHLGVGEIIVNAIENDGIMKGYDIETIKNISNSVSIPVIACGGSGGIHDLKIALEDANADAVAASSMFVFHGTHKAVLINMPTENELLKEGIYYER